MPSIHTLRTTLSCGPSDLGAEIELDITYTYCPCKGIEFVSAAPLCNGKPSPFYGAFADMEQDWLDDLARDWLDEDGLAEATRHAERERLIRDAAFQTDPRWTAQMLRDAERLLAEAR